MDTRFSDGFLMAKRKKRTNPHVPEKKRLRVIADQLWSRAVRDDWSNKCAVCGHWRCEAHHLIPRGHEATRYDLRNGIALCARCHQFDGDVAPHQNAAGWLKWLEEHCPTHHQWYTETFESGQHRAFGGTKTADYYCDVIRGLREYVDIGDFERIVGVRFTRWLEDNA